MGIVTTPSPATGVSLGIRNTPKPFEVQNDRFPRSIRFVVTTFPSGDRMIRKAFSRTVRRLSKWWRSLLILIATARAGGLVRQGSRLHQPNVDGVFDISSDRPAVVGVACPVALAERLGELAAPWLIFGTNRVEPAAICALNWTAWKPRSIGCRYSLRIQILQPPEAGLITLLETFANRCQPAYEVDNRSWARSDR